MKKYILFFIAVIYISISFLSFTYASDFKLIINDFKCEYDEVVIHYSIINYISYDRQNVSVVFRIKKDDIPIACDEQIVTIPKNADGSEINEVIIDVQCEEGSISLESDIFHDEINSNKQERIARFFSGCPRFKK
ncbi:hypothetical protein ACFL1Z_04565 [Thermodesulfobacteriota bacterium]